MDCKCETCGRENCQDRTKQDDVRIVTCCSDYIEHKQTNADRIRAMSDEELAKWIARTQIGAIKDAMNLLRLPYDEPDGLVEIGKTEVLEWLKQPAEDE